MKKQLLFLVVLGLLFSCNQTTTNQTDDKTATKEENSEVNHYGDNINVENPVSAEKMMAMLEENDSVSVTYKSTILSNCKRSGCWMDLDMGNGEIMKVTFKDYAFVIPLESEGKTATVEGVAKREIIPVDLLKHYAEDEGASEEEIAAITEDEIAYTFEAKGVIIED
ncbi:MAG: DUF4920 domain-containing protein [Bacteroidales bacterium]|nr:DUF4920 domain-containing protein [Bacteroidales bacterium]